MSNLASRSATAFSAVVQVTDDVIRVVVPTAAGALKVVSTVGIVVGAVLTPVFAAWAFYSAGNRMNEHLHLLCDDLQTVLMHFIVALCNDLCEDIRIHDSDSSDDETSSEDEDWTGMYFFKYNHIDHSMCKKIDFFQVF